MQGCNLSSRRESRRLGQGGYHGLVIDENWIDLLDCIEENARFHIGSLNADALATGKALFRQHEPLSFVDGCIIAYMQTEGLGYLYAFDDDFDVAEDVYRLDTATNPYNPD